MFADERGAFRRVVIRGAVAELFTLGFYRFWLATTIRRMLWSATSVENEALAYHGNGRELFLGFLLAIGILAPFYLLYFLAGIEAERWKAFASFPLGLAFIAFRQFAIYRARRYRLHRTSWRGLRFGMTGSGWKYAAIAMIRTFLSIVTLGLAHPWTQAALERYKMHTNFGDLEGRFEGTGRQFFARGWGLWAVLSLPAAVVVLLVVTKSKASGLIALLPVLLAVAAPFWFAAYKAVEWKWWVEGLRIGDVKFSSTLAKRALFGTYWSFVGVMLLVVIAGVAVGAAITFALFSMGAVVLPKTPVAGAPLALIGVWGLTYLVTLLGFGIAFRLFLIRRVWAIVCATTVVHNIDSTDAVAARPGTANALGEGFADSLDIVGF